MADRLYISIGKIPIEIGIEIEVLGKDTNCFEAKAIIRQAMMGKRAFTFR